MKVDLKKDLSTITTINEKYLSKLNDKLVWCICDSVEKMMLNEEDELELDLDFGTLIIKLINDEIKYKFIPSSFLNNSIIETIDNNKNILVDKLEESLVSKITNMYKNLL